MLLKQPQGEQQQVIEIDGVAGAQGTLVTRSDVLRQCKGAFVGKRARFNGAVFETAQKTQQDFGLGLFARAGNMAEDFSDRAKLFGFVVYDKAPFVTEQLNVLPQNPRAQGVERGDGGNLRTVRALPARPARSQPAHPLPHFTRGLVGERHREDVRRSDPALDHVGDAVSDDPGFAGAGAGEDQDRAIDGLHGRALRRVQTVQIQHLDAKCRGCQNPGKRNAAKRAPPGATGPSKRRGGVEGVASGRKTSAPSGNRLRSGPR